MGFTRDEAATLVLRHIIGTTNRLDLNMIKQIFIPEFVQKYFSNSQAIQEALELQYFAMLPSDNFYAFLQSLIEVKSFSNFLLI